MPERYRAGVQQSRFVEAKGGSVFAGRPRRTRISYRLRDPVRGRGRRVAWEKSRRKTLRQKPLGQHQRATSTPGWNQKYPSPRVTPTRLMRASAPWTCLLAERTLTTHTVSISRAGSRVGSWIGTPKRSQECSVATAAIRPRGPASQLGVTGEGARRLRRESPCGQEGASGGARTPESVDSKPAPPPAPGEISRSVTRDIPWQRTRDVAISQGFHISRRSWADSFHTLPRCVRPRTDETIEARGSEGTRRRPGSGGPARPGDPRARANRGVRRGSQSGA